MNINTFLPGIPISEEQCIGDSLVIINTAFETLSGGFKQVQEQIAAEFIDIAESNAFIKRTGDTISGYLQIGPDNPNVNANAKLTFGKTLVTTINGSANPTLPTIHCGTKDGAGNDLYITAQSTKGKIIFSAGTAGNPASPVEMMRIDSSVLNGAVGINAQTRTLESVLDVYGGASIKADSNGNALFISKNNEAATGTNYDRLECVMSNNTQVAYIGTANLGNGTSRALSLRTAGADRLFITTGGTVGIGTITPDPQYKLEVSGIIRCTNVSTTSDIRLKQNISTITDSLKKVNSIKGIEFDWNTAKQTAAEGRDYGVIAQDVEQVYPFAVKEGKDGYKTVNYSSLIPLLIEAIKDLTTEVNTLKASLNS